MLVEKPLIRRRWKAHFHKLLNKRDKDIVFGDLEHSKRRRYFGCPMCIKVEGIKGVIHRMSKGRSIELDEISTEFWKSTG